MKCAIIGCGRIAPCHIRAAEENNIEIVCLCDIDLQAVQELKHAFPYAENAKVYADYKEMLRENSHIDLVSVCTSSGLHGEIALYCIRQRKNVIIEKPIAMSMAEADMIVKEAEEYGVKVCACHQNRFNIPIQQLKRVLDKGALGKISHGSVCVRWYRDENYYSQADWRGTWAEDGGCLMNQCIHGIDLLRWCMGGEVESVFGVTCRQQHPYIEAEDLGMALVKFKNGAAASIEGSVNVYKTDLEEILCIFGEKGSAKISGTCANHMERLEFEGMAEEDADLTGFEEKTKNIYGNGHISVYADMICAIKENRPPYIDAKAGRDALELVLAIYKSAYSGKEVKLPLKECSSKDFKGKF